MISCSPFIHNEVVFRQDKHKISLKTYNFQAKKIALVCLAFSSLIPFYAKMIQSWMQFNFAMIDNSTLLFLLMFCWKFILQILN